MSFQHSRGFPISSNASAPFHLPEFPFFSVKKKKAKISPSALIPYAMAEKDTLKTSGSSLAPEPGINPPGGEEKSTTEIPYSAFTGLRKKQIAFLVAFAATFSPLSSFIYYPAIVSIAKDLSVTVELVTLTITSYMIVSGITPALVGGFADIVGRRPIYIVTFIIYVAANLGLALQRSYPALFVLRMLQSAGSSGEMARCS